MYAVDELLDGIVAALGDVGTAVLVAPPGTGKSTRIPPALLGASWRRDHERIVVLQPRRVAARAVAERLAAALGEPLGRTVGYRMRGDTKVSAATRLEVVTEGVLTRMLADDPMLDGVAAVVFDEFHERSVDADLGLALCTEVRGALRDDLRLLVMSATLDVEPVASLLGNPVVLSCAGIAHRVETVWCPVDSGRRWEDATASVVDRALTECRGDVLVFCPGVREIERIMERTGRAGHDVEVVPLHGSLSIGEQHRAVAPRPAGARRRVVVATNVAETSLTIDGIGVVVDGGLARRASFDPRRGMGRLRTVRISRASAAQRQGRAGRTGPGTCYRMWSEHDHTNLGAAEPPEIHTADLASLALDLAIWGTPDPTALLWIDPPPPARYGAAQELLRSLGAVGSDGRPTDVGRTFAELGLHPRLAAIVVAAAGRGQLGDGAAVAAVLADRDPLRNSGADLAERVGRIREFGRIAADADRIAKRMGGGRVVRSDLGDDALGPLLLAGFPDRVARRRSSTVAETSNGSGRRNTVTYRLARGGAVVISASDPLVDAEFLVVADAGTSPGRDDAQIRLASPVEYADLEATGLISTEDRVVWDARNHDVRARRERRYGDIVLSSGPLSDVPSGLLVDALLDGVRIEGLGLLRWSKEAHELRDRVAFRRRTGEITGETPTGDTSAAESWPDVTDGALRRHARTWLAPWLGGVRGRAELSRVDMAAVLRSMLDHGRLVELDRFAPTHLTVPSGSRVRVDYSLDPPVLAVKLQECFGLQETPTIGGDRRVAVVLHLLSPARRPLAITSDLASFWSGPYRQVRAEMRGRYPKHPWPEDPTSAVPTAKLTRSASRPNGFTGSGPDR